MGLSSLLGSVLSSSRSPRSARPTRATLDKSLGDRRAGPLLSDDVLAGLDGLDDPPPCPPLDPPSPRRRARRDYPAGTVGRSLSATFTRARQASTDAQVFAATGLPSPSRRARGGAREAETMRRSVSATYTRAPTESTDSFLPLSAPASAPAPATRQPRALPRSRARAMSDEQASAAEVGPAVVGKSQQQQQQRQQQPHDHQDHDRPPGLQLRSVSLSSTVTSGATVAASAAGLDPSPLPPNGNGAAWTRTRSTPPQFAARSGVAPAGSPAGRDPSPPPPNGNGAAWTRTRSTPPLFAAHDEAAAFSRPPCADGRGRRRGCDVVAADLGALVPRHVNGGHGRLCDDEAFPARPPTSPVITASPEAFPLYDALESRRLVRNLPALSRSRGGAANVPPSVAGAATATVDDPPPSPARQEMARKLSGGRLPPVQPRPHAPPPAAPPAAPPATAAAVAKVAAMPPAAPHANVPSPLPPSSLARTDSDLTSAASEGAAEPRVFFPSLSAPNLMPTAADEAREMWEARCAGAFPSSVSHQEPAPPRAAAGRKLQLRRPPPLKTPLGGGLGFSSGAGAPDLVDGGKRIPKYTAASSARLRDGGGGGDGGREGGGRALPAAGAGAGGGGGGGAAGRPCVTQPAERWPEGERSSKDQAASTPEREDRPASRPGAPPSAAGTWTAEAVSTGSATSGGSGRFSLHRRAAAEDVDLFELDEASQTSFDDMGTRSAVARARHGILPADPDDPLAKGLASLAPDRGGAEDYFVFGSDGQFKDGGFVITADGVMQQPDSMRAAYARGADDGEAPPSSTFIPVRSLDDFDKGPTLGAGAHGHVYLALHRGTNARMAVKVINVYDDEKRTQMHKELRTLFSHNNRHLVRSYGAYYDGAGYVAVTLEYMDRGALSDAVGKYGEIPEPVVRHIARDCLGGLLYLQKNRVLHRDFKTANILLSRRAGSAKLSDFGLVRDLIPGASTAQTFVGTLAYMSPERLHGSGYTYASDVWGLGISLLECILGRYPFEKPATYFDYLESASASPCDLVGDRVSAEMLDFVLQCTQLEPARRATVRELLGHRWLVGDGGGQTARDADRAQFLGWLNGMADVSEVAAAAAAAASDSSQLRADRAVAGRKDSPMARAARLNSP